MRARPSSRILLLNTKGEVLLFRFNFTKGALAGKTYWATPGGGVENTETFQQAAIRELHEETGLVVETVGAEIYRKEFVLQMPDGEHVMADERFFLVKTDAQDISNAHWTAHEKQVMDAHHWWSLAELTQTDDALFPKDLAELISAL